MRSRDRVSTKLLSLGFRWPQRFATNVKHAEIQRQIVPWKTSQKERQNNLEPCRVELVNGVCREEVKEGVSKRR